MWVAGSQASTHNDNARSWGTPCSAAVRWQALRHSPCVMPLVPYQPATHCMMVCDGAEPARAASSAAAARGLVPLAFAGFKTGRESASLWANAGKPSYQMQVVATAPAATNFEKPMAHPRTARCFVLLSLAVIGDTGIRDSPDIGERNHSFEIDGAAMSGVAHFAQSALPFLEHANRGYPAIWTGPSEIWCAPWPLFGRCAPTPPWSCGLPYPSLACTAETTPFPGP